MAVPNMKSEKQSENLLHFCSIVNIISSIIVLLLCLVIVIIVIIALITVLQGDKNDNPFAGVVISGSFFIFFFISGFIFFGIITLIWGIVFFKNKEVDYGFNVSLCNSIILGLLTIILFFFKAANTTISMIFLLFSFELFIQVIVLFILWKAKKEKTVKSD